MNFENEEGVDHLTHIFDFTGYEVALSFMRDKDSSIEAYIFNSFPLDSEGEDIDAYFEVYRVTFPDEEVYGYTVRMFNDTLQKFSDGFKNFGEAFIGLNDYLKLVFSHVKIMSENLKDK